MKWKCRDKSEWHLWWAWWPVWIEGTWYLFECVARRWKPYSYVSGGSYIYARSLPAVKAAKERIVNQLAEQRVKVDRERRRACLHE